MKTKYFATIVLVLLAASSAFAYGYGHEDLYRAHRYKDDGRDYDARDLFKRVARDAYNSDIRREACYYVGFCSVKMNDPWQAIRDYKWFLDEFDRGYSSYSNKFVPDALYVLGRTYETVHENSDARYYYRRCIDRFPYNDFADKSRDRLRYLGDYNDHDNDHHYSVNMSVQSLSGKTQKSVKTEVSKNDPFQNLKIDTEKIERVNAFIGSVKTLNGVEKAMEQLSDSDKKLEVVQENLNLLTKKQKFEQLHNNK